MPKLLAWLLTVLLAHVVAPAAWLGTANAQPPQAEPQELIALELALPAGKSVYKFERTSWTLLCESDCTVRVPPTTYLLAVGSSPERLTELKDPVTLVHDAKVTLTLTSREASRVAGGMLILVGVPIALFGIIAGAVLLSEPSCDDCQSGLATLVGLGGLIGGVFVGAVTITPGIRLALRPDTLALRVSPRFSQPARGVKLVPAKRGVGLALLW